MEPDSQIVIGPDGTVLAASGQLPSGLVDVRLEECEGLSKEIREGAKALLHELRRSGDRIALQTVALDSGARTEQLVAIEALAVRRTPTDVRALLTSKLGVLSFQAATADVTLSIVVADQMPPVVHLDSDKVGWAITTLVGNALRYVRSGSRRMPGGTIHVRAGFDPAGSRVTIEVQDDGPGIPADTVTRLFRRDGLNVRGAGLALLLISDICAAHGGAVEIRSNTDGPEHGTAVRLSFPTR
jgi:signal transduction histidine kinase